jgi:hypothetical protein
MRKVIFSLFLLVFAVPALADKQQDQFDQKDVYDAFGELKLKPSTGVTLEEDVTSRIKRYMANLLYPVDLTSFVRPEEAPQRGQVYWRCSIREWTRNEPCKPFARASML